MQHGPQLGHGVHAGDAQLAHVGQQFGKPLGHVAGLKAARLPLKRDGFQRLLHFLGAGDLGVLAEGVDHLGGFAAVRALPDHELGRHRRVLHGLGQVHTGTHQLVDHGGHLVTGHAGVT